MRLRMLTLQVTVFLMTLAAAGAAQAVEPQDEASVLVVVAHALCSAKTSMRAVLDSRTAYASPILEGKFTQLGLDQELARALLDQNRGGPIPSDADYGCLRVAPGNTIEDAFGPKGDASHEDQRWVAFRKVFPGVNGYAAFGRPAFSSTGESAAVYFFYTCGLKCGKGRVYLVKRSDRSWAVSKELVLWDF